MVYEKPPPAIMLDVNLSKGNYFINVECVVDTCSTISLISLSLVKYLNFQSSDKFRLNYEGLNKSSLEILGDLDLFMKISNNKACLNFKVVPDETMPHKCVLGRDFLSLDSFCCIIKGNTILIESNEVKSTITTCAS